MKNNILHLTLHRQWFDQIAKEIKKIEYREVKEYWRKRIENRDYSEIYFRNGYSENSPFMRVEYKGWYFETCNRVEFYALKLGAILEIRNWEKK